MNDSINLAAGNRYTVPVTKRVTCVYERLHWSVCAPRLLLLLLLLLLPVCVVTIGSRAARVDFRFQKFRRRKVYVE